VQKRGLSDICESTRSAGHYSITRLQSFIIISRSWSEHCSLQRASFIRYARTSHATARSRRTDAAAFCFQTISSALAGITIVRKSQRNRYDAAGVVSFETPIISYLIALCIAIKIPQREMKNAYRELYYRVLRDLSTELHRSCRAVSRADTRWQRVSTRMPPSRRRE